MVAWNLADEPVDAVIEVVVEEFPWAACVHLP
jgi:hypothetical protein